MQLKPSTLLLYICLNVWTACLIGGNQASQRDHWELIENDSRFISYQDLMTTAKRYSESNVTTYSEMIFDIGRKQLIVGARDVLYRMSFDLDVIERTDWMAEPNQIAMCQAKGQSEKLCHNYVRVLHQFGDNWLYACGTNAFNPNCTILQMENLTVSNYESGVGKCPFNPQSNITSLMTDNGIIFIGTTTDFSGSDAAIIKSNVHHQQFQNSIIRTKQYNNDWLNNPQFVGSFSAGNFVYFLFREIAVEYRNCGKVIYSRIARVCKSDAGGDHLLRDNWTSFLKARLQCSLPGEYPFYFNEIQGMAYSRTENTLYATFNTPENSLHGSAVCAYNLTAINDAFNGPFRYQDNVEGPWKIVHSTHDSQFRCEIPNDHTKSEHLLESSKYQLMDKAVQPITHTPLYYSQFERFSHIAVNIVHTKAEMITMLYVATNKNFIKKLSVKNNGHTNNIVQTCLIEVWKIQDDHILNMEYLKTTDSLYVGTEQSLTRIPAHHCSRHVSRKSCLNAMDPYCGWNELLERCTALELSIDLTKYWIQANVTRCPQLTAPIDGAWSTWSNWYTCKIYGDDDGSCMCRNRECNNPIPQNGGQDCIGITTEVTNCTVHGGWTEWSAWSACSQTCGIAVKTRRRTCGNPKPAFNGRTCVGSERAEMYCLHLPPCPAPKPVPIDGGWGPWGEWSECSAECGGGFRIRRRECNDPMPQNGGIECSGCKIDYEDCNLHPCPEVRKLSGWTPWLAPYNKIQNNEAGYIEKRFRFACRARTADTESVHISMTKTETRICREGVCYRHNDANTAEDNEHTTADWGPCNATCGGGVQFREFAEDRRGHNGQQSRPCNTQPCLKANRSNEVISNNAWSTCWSDWSPCSVSCGVGVRQRTCKCLNAYEKLCHGESQQEEKCEMPACSTDKLGWSSWSDWSECNEDGFRYRYRKCFKEHYKLHECPGETYEKASCTASLCEDKQILSATVFGSIITIVLLLYMLSIWLTFWLTRRHYSPAISLLKNNTSNTSTYDMYSNQYCSVPTKDIYDVQLKVKRQSSFNTMRSNTNTKNFNSGTLNRNNITHNHTPKVLAKTHNDCDTGSLKFNSNTLNNYRTNLDDEKF